MVRVVQGGLEGPDGKVCFRRRQLLVVLVAPEGLVGPVGLSVLVDLLAFLQALENDETMEVRRLHHLHRGRPVAGVATGHDEEALNRSDWNGDLACCDDHYGRSDLALVKQCAIGWSGFEGWQAQLSSLVEGVSRWYLALGMQERFQGLPAADVNDILKEIMDDDVKKS